MIETPKGRVTIKLDWMKQTGIAANMTLYGPDGWKADTRYWLEEVSQNPERDEDGTLAEVISEWTQMPTADAEALVEETVSRYRGSSAFEREVKINRQAKRLMGIVAVGVVLALVGVAALVWLLVSALT